jgi:hypothetical protein
MVATFERGGRLKTTHQLLASPRPNLVRVWSKDLTGLDAEAQSLVQNLMIDAGDFLARKEARENGQ